MSNFKELAFQQALPDDVAVLMLQPLSNRTLMVMFQLLLFVAYNTDQLIIATSNYGLQTRNNEASKANSDSEASMASSDSEASMASSDSKAPMASSDSDNRFLPQVSTCAGSGNIDLSKSMGIHAAYGFIIALLVSLVGLKFLGSGTNPFNTHPWTMWLFITTSFAYFIALLAEITIAGRAPTTSNLFRYLYLISGAVACELLGFVLVGAFGLLLMNPSAFLLIVLLRRTNKQITTTTTQKITQVGEIQMTSQSSV